MAIQLGKAPRRIVAVLLAVIVLAACAFAWYVSDYSRADQTAMSAASDANGAADGVVVRHLEGSFLAGDTLAFEPVDPVAGLVLYPGAKVQPEAYAPLLTQCAERGVLCIQVASPFNLAIMDANAAERYQKQYPQIDKWIVAGHSMGGVAAASYVANHGQSADALVLLASYPADDLARYKGSVLSVIGTEDGVLNRENYNNARSKLPADAAELVIEGGNHAYYGNYGEQSGDGQAHITREQQQAQTVDALMTLLDEHAE